MSFYDVVAAAARNGEGPGGGGFDFDLSSLLSPTMRGAGKDLGLGVLAGQGVKKTAGKVAGGVGGKALGTAVAGPLGGMVGGAVGGKVGEFAGGLLGGKGKAGPRFDIPMMEPTQEPLDPGFLSALMQQGVPGYATGIMDQPGGLAMVGELGPELAMLQPRSPVIPMDFSTQVGDYADEPAAQMGQHSGLIAELARALGPNPFSDHGSLGGFEHAIMQSLPGHHHNAGRIAGAGLGALGNILTNRELTAQSDVDKLNESLRTRAATRNEDLRKRSAEDRKTAAERGTLKFKAGLEQETEAGKDAAKRRFILSDKVAGKLGLPSGERVTFEQYTKALDSAKDTLPTNEFDRVLAASPAEWSKYVSRKGELTKTEAAAKPKAARPTTGEQNKAAAFHSRARKAIDSVATLEDTGSSIEDRIANTSTNNPIVAGLSGMAPNVLKGDDRQRYDNAKMAFALALLRKESGSAINKDEFNKIDKAFFVQPGDRPKTIEQKKAARDAAIEGLQMEAAGGVQEGAGLSDEDAYQEYLQLTGNQ